MNLRFRIHQARITGVRVTLRKSVRKLFNPLTLARERRRAYTTSSYDVFDAQRHGTIVSRLKLPPSELLSEHRDTLLQAAMHYCQHSFFLPGSGWQQWYHGAEVQGLEGFRYSQEEFPYEIDDAGIWVTHLVNSTNTIESQRVWNLIFGDDKQQMEASHKELDSSKTSPDLNIGYRAIDWQRDMRSGYSWTEGQWWRDLRIDLAKGVDPKVPWDLGRMHHLLHLSLAHYVSNNDSQRAQFVRQFRSQVLDFIALNPLGFGIQWKSPMDVAIRLANILVAWDLLKVQGWNADVEFERVVTRSTYEHARFVLENLEWSDGMRANHYLSNLAGLSVYAAYVPDSGLNARIRELLRRSLPEETLYQFQEDGSHFEASLRYHYFSTEMLCWSVAFHSLADYKAERPEYRSDSVPLDSTVGKVREPSLGTVIDERLRSILEFSDRSLYSTGSCPQIGDNDGGHFLPFLPVRDAGTVDSSLLDQRPVIALNAALLQTHNPNPGVQFHFELMQSLLSSIGEGRVPAVNSELQSTPQNINQTFGLSRFQFSSFTCFLRAGSIGQRGKGGHAHNDQLSLTLEVDGNEVFCDPGTYVYTALPEQRNLFRSTRMHNTLCIDGLEQNDISSHSSESLFWMQSNRADAKILVHERDSWSAQHNGFGSTHQRTVTFRDSEILVSDSCNDNRMKTVRFHLHPSCVVEKHGPHLVRIRRATSVIELYCGTEEIICTTSLYSPEYGSCVQAQYLSVSTKATLIETRVTIVTS